ncbi:MAG: ABC transporter permease [Myxococcota bacterium]
MADAPGAIPLDAWDLAIAAGLVLVAGAVSLVLRLGLEGKLALASLRTVVQLLLIGYVLEWVFAVDVPWAILALLAVMIAAAGRAAVQRASRTFRGAYWRAFLSLAITGTATTFMVTSAVVGIEPWWRPQYVIPLLGMVLGNSLTGISLCLDSLLETLDAGRDRVELDLSLGATRWQAVREPLADAVRRGMIPIINSMMVVGIVSLPGMMTGQILAGADPLPAVKYQVVVMFMIAAGTSLGCISVALFAYRRLFNERHQLRADRITPR